MNDSSKEMTPKVALSIVTMIFFMWGFITCLNDILIPHLKAVFELNYTRAMLIQFTFFGAYFLMSIPMGKIVEKVGYKNGIVIGLVITGIGALGFWPAAELRVYELFLGALFVLASGITMLQVAANPYAALLGPEETSSSRLTLVQAFNSFGTAVAPWFGGMLILSSTVLSMTDFEALSTTEQLAYRTQEAQSVQGPYVGLAITLFLLAVAIFLFKLPVLKELTEKSAKSNHSLMDAWNVSHVRYGVLAIFFYVGAEVCVGSVMINYLALPEIGNITEQEAAKYVSFYWSLAMVGRFIGSGIMMKFSPRLLLAGFASMNVLLLVTTILGSGTIALVSVISIGLFNSIMFPTIFSLGIERVGTLTSQASSLLIMAIVGGAILPVIQGWFADSLGLQISFLVPLLGYAYIIFYGLSGSKVKI